VSTKCAITSGMSDACAITSGMSDACIDSINLPELRSLYLQTNFVNRFCPQEIPLFIEEVRKWIHFDEYFYVHVLSTTSDGTVRRQVKCIKDNNSYKKGQTVSSRLNETPKPYVRKLVKLVRDYILEYDCQMYKIQLSGQQYSLAQSIRIRDADGMKKRIREILRPFLMFNRHWCDSTWRNPWSQWIPQGGWGRLEEKLGNEAVTRLERAIDLVSERRRQNGTDHKFKDIPMVDVLNIICENENGCTLGDVRT